MEIFWLVVLTNLNAAGVAVLYYRQRRISRNALDLVRILRETGEKLLAENTKLRNRVFMAQAAHVAMQLHQYEEFKRHHARCQNQPPEAPNEAPAASTDN